VDLLGFPRKNKEVQVLLSDPEGRPEGEGKTGRHLKLRKLDDPPRPSVIRCLRIASALAQPSPDECMRRGRYVSATADTHPRAAQSDARN
jgi:hypothetical protein